MFFDKSRCFQWFHQELHQNTPQKKCKKKGLPHYLMRQPLPIGSVLGNRTPDSAVRGLRLNLLTNTPYSLFIYAVQRKIYYTEELPSCPVLFLFFSKLFWGPDGYRGVGRPEFASSFPRSLIPSFRGANSSHNSRPKSAVSPVAGPTSLLPVPREALSLRFGEQILHTTSGRKAQFRRWPDQHLCSPFPAKPYVFVSGSKFFTQLPAGKRNFVGVPAGRFAPRSPLSLIPSFRGANSSHNFRPECAVPPATRPIGLLPAPR